MSLLKFFSASPLPGSFYHCIWVPLGSDPTCFFWPHSWSLLILSALQLSGTTAAHRTGLSHAWACSCATCCVYLAHFSAAWTLNLELKCCLLRQSRVISLLCGNTLSAMLWLAICWYPSLKWWAVPCLIDLSATNTSCRAGPILVNWGLSGAIWQPTLGCIQYCGRCAQLVLGSADVPCVQWAEKLFHVQ